MDDQFAMTTRFKIALEERNVWGPFMGMAIGAPSIAPVAFNWTQQPYAALAWELDYPDPYHVVLGVKTGSGWAPFQMFYPPTLPGSNRFWAPSVSCHQTPACSNEIDGIRLAFNSSVSGHSIQVQILNCGNWSVYPGRPTLHPSTVPFFPTGDGLAIFPEREVLTSSPFTMDHSAISVDGVGFLRRSEWNRSRELLIIRDTTVSRLLLGNIILKTGNDLQRIDWNRGFDTLIVGMNTTIEDEFRTKPFSVQQGMQLQYVAKDGKRGTHSLPNNMYLKLQVVKASNNQVLASLGQLHPRTLAQGRRTVNATQSLNAFVGEEVYFRLSLVGADSTVSFAVYDHYTQPGESLPKSFDEMEGSGLSASPSHCMLSQNYPNPFGRTSLGSPTTDIEFSIPERMKVHLSVLDALGREVKVLVDEYKDPGSHRAHFNAENLPGGLYCYRLIADGNVLVRKMSLIR